MEVRSFNDDYHEVGQLVLNAQVNKETYFFYPVYKTVEEMKKDWEGKELILMVAEEDNQIIGFGGLDLVRKEGNPNADLYGILVNPLYRSQGVGSALMEALIRKAKEVGIRSIYAQIETDNEEGIDFLIKHGFEYKRSFFRMEMNEPIFQEVNCPEGIEIRRSKAIKDKAQFLETYEEIFGNPKDGEKQLAILSDPNHGHEIFLMYRVSRSTGKEKLIGFCGVESIEEDGKMNRRIDTLGVIDKYGRRGMGKVLYMTVLNYYWSLPDTRKISITLKSSSENVKKFYLSCGMEETQSTETYKYEIED
ncbi:MAG: [ribosomal protein S18]-alanine N-acetyltransferase [Epulopiscium sp.]|jgi:ribosomal protein S18 acetylase RimI-like enzyme|nr:ribosomal-protein-alanine acetyltransferase [Defluviitaleaceae bacterium]MDK2788458.1 [ribosomal protein S18]-alanine N-acetyltransferase [Candidatus Epulonipiscium sp.]HHW66405.1 GNAT family N-acetyltransferase [Candidatus Epulonipiscium sp.]